MNGKKVGFLKCLLFTICSVLVLDSLAPAPARFGVRSITMWVVLALVFFIPYGLISAELGSTYPDDGGITAWVTRAYGEHLGVQTGWFYWVNVAFWMPAVFVTFAWWLSYSFFPNAPAWVMAALAVVMCWVIVAVGIGGVELSVTVTAVAAYCKMAILLLFGALGIAYCVRFGPASDFSPASFQLRSFGDLSSGVAVIVYNLLGFELIGSIGGQIENPGRTVPKMTVIAGFVITFLYLLGTFGILAALREVSEMDGFYDALSQLCRVCGPAQTVVRDVLVVATCLTMVSNMLSWTLGANESLIAASLDRRSPFLGKRSRRGTAVNLYLTMGVLSTVMLLLNFAFGSEDANAIFWDVLSFSFVIFLTPYVFLFLSAIRLRYIDPDTTRVYEVPGGLGGMWIAAGLCLLCVGTGIFFLFRDDLAAGNLFAFWVKVLGTALCVSAGELLYRSKAVPEPD